MARVWSSIRRRAEASRARAPNRTASLSMRLPHRDANPQEHRRDRATLTHGANPGQATGTRASATQPLTKPHRAAGQAGLALHRFALPARETCAGTRKQARVVCFAAPSLCDPKQARACGASTRSLLVLSERV